MEEVAAGDLLTHPPTARGQKADAAALRLFLLQPPLVHCFDAAPLTASWSLLCVSASIPVDRGTFSRPVPTTIPWDLNRLRVQQ